MKTLIHFLLILTVGIASAQRGIDPTDEDVQLAKKLREQYGKEDVAILESSDMVSFGISKDGSKVTVSNKIREKLMNINHRADIHKYEFYDSESKIEQFSLKFRNDKKANFMVQDEFYKDSDLFYNDARVKHMAVDFPVQGYTYNYELDKSYNDVKYFTSLYFNDEYPVINKKISIAVPKWLNVELREFNFSGYSISKNQTVNSDGETVFTYELKNAPAFYKDENAPGRTYVYPHILVLAKSYTKDGKENRLFTDSADLYKWYKSLVDMMEDDPSAFKAKVDELTAAAKSDEEKIKNIYYWVQDNIRYIAFEDGIAGFKPDESQNVFTKRYGDCKGMANLIKQMLKAAGFDARLTWIGTKHISYDYTVPSLAVDNHMICTLLYKGKKFYLDGTEKFGALGVNAERIQGKEVMIEDGDKFIIDKIPTSNTEVNKETYAIRLAIDNETLKGKCTKTFMGESCAEFLYGYNRFGQERKQDALQNYLSLRNKNIQVSNVVTSDLKNREQQLKLDYDVAVNNKVSSFDGEIYVDIDFMKEFNDFDFKERKTDYEFDYKSDYLSSVTLQIPAGYKVTKLPENINVSGKDYDVAITFTQTPKEIICKKNFVFKNGVIKTTEFTAWNDFIKNLNTIYNQQIVLSKS
ncbi:transglutaminase domain-containing protein [Flavobacterium sp. MAH-1]|uniref:Transglutaminase domain-containing protein n=1 Tax=Flavobacterium agri TaxID=2743471 RepID=A0A7Y9C5Y1_9FLAO|nr:transglutaminase domain-containing protein [Flavobacterium agri]NUY81737.1 transglutaminase domain-containing protein [Flavobacterium agri]NYA71761.1 transglutaminase domain-containing protein [Flavobacterium agri]